jgi:hypothetical protein
MAPKYSGNIGRAPTKKFECQVLGDGLGFYFEKQVEGKLGSTGVIHTNAELDFNVINRGLRLSL